ncbi:MAG TPA: hypothetical protein VG101_10140 [Puia sp.]|jgi:hypothetical protein|nr:hypothetical protein [Puia sp.]
METLTKRSFFVLAALLAFTTLRAQTADDIVNKYVTAIGGKDALSNVKSLVMTGTTSVMGNDGNSTVTLVVGKGYKSDMDFAGTKVINCITPTQGWTLNPFMGAATPTAIPDEQLKGGQIQLQLDPLANAAALGYKVEFVGKDSADFKLKLSGNGQNITFFINQTTSLLDKFMTTVSGGGQSIDITISFSDYRKLDGGLMYPFSQTAEYPQATLAFAYKTATVNSTIDPSVFDMPKQ